MKLLLLTLLAFAPAQADASGGATALSLEPTWYGTAVDGAGDVDLDGCDDVILGAWWVAGGRGLQGRVVVFSGRDGKILHSIAGPEENALFGLAVAGAGDADDDGAGDFLIGSPQSAASGRRTGSVRLYSGRTGELLHVVEGDKQALLFGLSLATAGDANQDGFDDFVVGAPGVGLDGQGDGQGRAFLFSGKSGKQMEEWKGKKKGDRFGWAVSGAGDVNGDGSGDVVVGAWGGDYVQVLSGRGKLLQEFQSKPRGGRYGFAVGGGGDVDADGMGDVVVGVPRGETTGALAVSVKLEKDLFEWPRELASGKEGWSFGVSVDIAGDVNGDGFFDIIVGDPGFPYQLRDSSGDELSSFLGRLRGDASRPGRAYVYSGQDGSVLHVLEGKHADDWYGVRVRGAGDVDQDGNGDFVVASGNTGGVLARVYSGRTGKLLHELSL